MSRAPRASILPAALTALACALAWGAAEQSSPPTHHGSQPHEKLQEVTITAQRAQLAQRVQTFVDKIAGPLFDGGLARWGMRVCPLVSGLPREDGEFILGRVSDVARAAGVPLAGESCNPNLYILVTAQPQELLRAMAERNFLYTFGFDSSPGVEASAHGPQAQPETGLAPPPVAIQEFISKPGAVRVLYRDIPYNPDASGSCDFASASSHAIVSAAKVGPITMSGDNWYIDSQQSRGYCVVWYLFRAFVIVDQARLRGVTLGQFADYVAMVGLAEIKPADTLADAPTILKLFNGAPHASAAGMTDWDLAFLKSLYKGQQLHGQLQRQRRNVVQNMVNELLH